MREALISPSAISSNVEMLKAMTVHQQMLVVVKADGYGHGALTSANAAIDGGADWLGTADVEEALSLRKSGISVPILAWLFGPREDLREAVEKNVDLGVSSVSQLRHVASSAQAKNPARIHIKVDTGLGRSGADPREWEDLFESAKVLQAEGSVYVVGLFTHLSGTTLIDDAAQGALFRKAHDALASKGVNPELLHVVSSTGASDLPDLGHGMVRVGAAAYGIPVTERYRSAGLRPAMRVRAQLILVKRVAKGLGVGYGHAYRTSSETNLGLVPLGYADGIPRHALNSGPVTVDGKRFLVSGRISMDQFSVDFGQFCPREGDWVTLWGDPDLGEPSVEDWAASAGTIAYEIVSRVGPRLHRVVVQ